MSGTKIRPAYGKEVWMKMKDERNIFGGSMLLLGAAALLLHKLGILEGIGFWSIAFTICLAGTLIEGIFKRNFTLMLFSAAFLIIINDKLLRLEAITPWPVLGAAALGSVCMGLLFPAAVRGRRSIMWRILFLTGAAALVISSLKGWETDFWAIVFTVFLVGTLIEGIFRRSSWRILFSIAFLIIVNDELLHLEAITPWPVLGAALLGSIGMQLLFPGSGRCVRAVIGEHDALVSASKRSGDKVYYESNFGEMVRYISGEISKVSLECHFGSMQVYFTDAQLSGGTASVDVEVAFGNMVLYIPSSWKVVLNMENTFGRTEEKGECSLEEEKVLYIKGETAFGYLQVRYV